MPARNPMRVLVAEPAKPMHAILRKVLAENGYDDLVFATSSEEAWDLLSRGETFDFALLDFVLASRDNLDLIWKITDDHRNYALRIMLMGQGAPIGVVDEAMRLGVREYVNKPFTPYILGVKIDKMLYGNRTLVDRYEPAPDEAPDKAKEKLEKEKATQSKTAAQVELKAKKAFAEGYELLQLRKYDQAIAKFAQAVKHRMLFPEAYKGIAEAFRGKGDLDRAAQFLSKAAETYAWLDKEEHATAMFERARKGDPKAPNPFKTVAEHLRKQKDVDKVIRFYEQAALLSPGDPDVAVGLAKAYMDKGDTQNAARVMRPVMDRENVDPEFKQLFVDMGVNGGAPKGRKGRSGSFIEGGRVSFEGSDKRKAPRVPLAEYATRHPRLTQHLPVVDISLTGIGFKPMGEEFEIGQSVTFDLVSMGDVKTKELEAVVRRVALTVIGCEFQHLSAKQIELVKGLVSR